MNEQTESPAKRFFKELEELRGEMRCGVNFDSVMRRFLYGGVLPAAYFYIAGFANGELTEHLLDAMMNDRRGAEALKQKRVDFLLYALPYAEVTHTDDKTAALTAVYGGSSLLLIEGFDGYILLDTKKLPQRGIEEPVKDKVLRGSRDGFTETLMQNAALIRRRIRDNRLIFEKKTVGTVSRTDLLLCYLDGAADGKYLEKLRAALSGVRTSALNLGLETLTELLIGKTILNPFPKVRYTERPDAASAMLLEGSVILLCDNYPAAMILPTSIFDFLQDTDDFYFSPVIGGYMKLVRNTVYIFSLVLTPLWFMLQKIPSFLPPQLDFLFYKGESFLPLLLQLLLVEIAIDGLKLASLNTPDTLSNSLSVISGLILGDLAVNVGWLSEQVILYMAFVAIANFTQPSYELGYAFKFMRMLTLILIELFSFYGLFIGAGVTLLLILTNRSFSSDRGYLYPLIPFDRKAMFKLVFRGKASAEKYFRKMN